MKRAGVVNEGGQTIFTVWAPLHENMFLHFVNGDDRRLQMEKDNEGYFVLNLPQCPTRTRYFFRPEDEKDLPDPASQYQPEGVHGPSEVIDHDSFQWHDREWKGIPLRQMIIYELHVGTFTREGTFEAIVPRLDELSELGVNCIELMPVAQFPGEHNWGYDGAFPYAVQNSYGGPLGLKKLVDACHQKGIAIFLDVVYNHLGPEGNYLGEYGPYFTDRYKTPWGDAINFDGEYSDGVRDFFSENVIYWFRYFHLDGLRLDAIHSIYDSGAVHFWEYCHNKVQILEQEVGRKLYMVAESDLNNPKVIQSPSQAGYGFDAQWLDDFHHGLYVLLDTAGKPLYEDFGSIQQLAKAYNEGFIHSGEYVKFRKRKHGRSSAGISGDKFIVFNQNHDQVGNRVKGERLSMLVDFEKQKLAAAAMLLAPYVPMLFMGEEYSDPTPFYYFVSHSDPELIKSVQKGRKEEFANFKWDVEPPDPQDVKTFEDSILQWNKRNQGEHQIMLSWFRELIQFRSVNSVFHNYNKDDCKATTFDNCGLALERHSIGKKESVLCLFNFSEKCINYQLPPNSSLGKKLLDSKDNKWSVRMTQEGERKEVSFKAGDNIELPCWAVYVLSN